MGMLTGVRLIGEAIETTFSALGQWPPRSSFLSPDWLFQSFALIHMGTF